jgi:hypothetical protein
MLIDLSESLVSSRLGYLVETLEIKVRRREMNDSAVHKMMSRYLATLLAIIPNLTTLNCLDCESMGDVILNRIEWLGGLKKLGLTISDPIGLNKLLQLDKLEELILDARVGVGKKKDRRLPAKDFSEEEGFKINRNNFSLDLSGDTSHPLVLSFLCSLHALSTLSITLKDEDDKLLPALSVLSHSTTSLTLQTNLPVHSSQSPLCLNSQLELLYKLKALHLSGNGF